ncbi:MULTISPECIES: hypothetical protein [unclassified Streptomyces]|uniref:hypothetical protein n=1 Tax=unclassified Streptomyces TaxID=2593676 RepID=UPI0006AFF715|nr:MULTISPECIES: hypothetical protein [unclassified Streptomyces]KOX18966.1 hypothetical protein ADL06_30230 [Streptomyces sp. NRRL F-6491]KOX37593.1 hypothetical protein ADL08_29475 [Streptomyces sp. NRRL F-6492]
MFRTTRAPAAFAALLGLVLGLLVWGAPGARAATVVSVPAVSTTAVSVPAVSTTATASAASVVSLPGAAVPGCDPGGRPAGAGADGPVVPPRAHGFAELLPALAADRAPGGDRPVDAAGRVPAPGREPPDLVPPSPVELSVLRV